MPAKRSKRRRTVASKRRKVTSKRRKVPSKRRKVTSKRKTSRGSSSGKKVTLKQVAEQLPLIRLIARVKGGPSAKRALLRAGGPPLAKALCSICKNIQAKTICTRKQLSPAQKRLLERFASGNSTAVKRVLSQKGGLLPLLPLIGTVGPAIAGLASGIRMIKGMFGR